MGLNRICKSNLNLFYKINIFSNFNDEKKTKFNLINRIKKNNFNDKLNLIKINPNDYKLNDKKQSVEDKQNNLICRFNYERMKNKNTWKYHLIKNFSNQQIRNSYLNLNGILKIFYFNDENKL